MLIQFREQLEKDKFKRLNNSNQIQNTEKAIKATNSTKGVTNTTRGGPNRATKGGGPSRTIYGDANTVTRSVSETTPTTTRPRSGATPTRQTSYTKYTRSKTKGLSTSTKIKTTTTETQTVTNYTKLKQSGPPNSKSGQYFPIGSITSSLMSPFGEGPCFPSSGHGIKGYTPNGGFSATAMIQKSWRRQQHTKQVKQEQTVKVKQYAPRRDVRPASMDSFDSTMGMAGTPGSTFGDILGDDDEVEFI